MVAQERVAQMQKWLEAAIADPDNGPLMERPERMIVAYHDGPGVQFLNAAGKPMLSEFIRDVELAVTLFNTLRFHIGAPSSHREGAEAMREACAKLCESHVEGQNNRADGTSFHLTPKNPRYKDGTLNGMAYAAAIRALPIPESPVDAP